jgi:hypothetical protein
MNDTIGTIKNTERERTGQSKSFSHPDDDFRYGRSTNLHQCRREGR